MQTIVPIYNAEQVDFRFNTMPAIRFEKWNRQIEKVAMLNEDEHIPDAVAIFEAETQPAVASESLQKCGLNILPLIFEKAYFVYSVANEKSVVQKSSTTFSLFKNGWKWINDRNLQDFLNVATQSLVKHDLHLALNLRYEADFRASAVEVKFILYWNLLQSLAKKFCEAKRESPLSEETIEQMLGVAEEELSKAAALPEAERTEKYNLVKQNLKYRLREKSHREIILDFLKNKCHLNVEESVIKDIIALHGKIAKNAPLEMSKEVMQTYKNLDYLSRIATIVCLTDFDPKFSRYLQVHQFMGPKFFGWD